MTTTNFSLNMHICAGCCCGAPTTKPLICSSREMACLEDLFLKKTSSKKIDDIVDAKVFNLPVIHCKCGAEILLIRNAASTGKAIEWHVQNCSLTKKAKNSAECMEKLNRHLIEQVIEVAAETEEIEKTVTKKTH